MKILLLALVALALPPAGSAQVSLTPRLGAGQFAEGVLAEYGLSLDYDAGTHLAPRLDLTGQLLGTGCAGWCDLRPWILTAGAAYRRRAVSLGAAVGTFRQGDDARTGLGPRENHPTWELHAGLGRRWTWEARYRRIYNPAPEDDGWQVVLSLGRRITLR